MGDRAARVSHVEARAEADDKLRRGYQVERAIEEAVGRFPGGDDDPEDRELLLLR